MTVTFDKIPKAPAYKRVSRAIEEKILARTLLPGDALPTESELADQFGLNRSTVREGLRQLEMAGLIERRNGGKKLYVTRPHTRDIATGLSRAMTLHDVTFYEVWEAMMVLEPEAARLAAERITPEQLTVLEDIVSGTPAPDDDMIVEQAVRFFNHIAASTGNQVLMMNQEPLSLLLRPSLKIMVGRVPQAKARILSAQREIVDALKNKDAPRAAEWMRKHIVDFRRGYGLAGIDLDRVIA